MKNIYTLLVIAISSLSYGQLLYEDFNYTFPGNIGGNTTTVPETNNNWTTVNNTQVGTIDILNGSLSYSGLQSSTGNKVYLPGSNTSTPRDIYRSFTQITGPTSAYYSVLINVIDNTQLLTSPPAAGNTTAYFMAFTSGINGTGTFGGRIAATVSTVDNTKYRLHIQNNSGGASSLYTEFPQDLIFGQTYLIVVKLDTTTTPPTASLWVNPSTLGGAEPTGAVTNNTGTGTGANFNTILLRNAAATAKVEVDEIRVGNTFAEVTPQNLSSATFDQITGLKFYPNPAKNILNIESALNKTKEVTIFDITGKKVLESNSVVKSISIEKLISGVYNVKVVEEGKISIKKLIIE